MFGEPGVGVGWVLDRAPRVTRTRRRARAAAVVEPLGFDGPDGPIASILRAAHRKAPLRRGPLSAPEVAFLAEWSAGLVAVAVALGRRAAELGFEVAREELERGRMPPSLFAALSSEVERRLTGLPRSTVDGWSVLAELTEAIAPEHALPLADLDLDAARALHDRGLLRVVSAGALWIPTPLAPVARARADGAAAPRAVGRWSAGLHEAGEWLGQPVALALLARHAGALEALATGDGPAEARAGACLGWLVTATGAPRDRAVGHAVRALRDLGSAHPDAPPLRLALAESFRVAGRPDALAAVLDGLDGPRAALVHARAAFNAGRAAAAEPLLARAQQAEADEAAAAGAWLTRAHVARDRGAAEAAFVALEEAEARHARWGGARWQLEGRMVGAVIHLELGRPERAAALLGDRDATETALDAACLPPGRRGALASFVALARELSGRLDEAAEALERALRAPAPPLFVALWRVYAGRVALARGRLDDAVDELERAEAALREADAGPSRSTALALLAVTRAARGEPWRPPLDAARRLAADPARASVVQVCRVAARALHACPVSPGAAAERLPPRAWSALARLAPRPRGEHDSLHLRCAHALAAHTLRRRELDVARHETVRLHPRRRAFTYRGVEVSLAARSPMWRVRRVLADAGDRALPPAELTRRVWGERLVEGSGRNRLRVALSHLRAAGLRDAITRSEGGYALVGCVNDAD